MFVCYIVNITTQLSVCWKESN